MKKNTNHFERLSQAQQAENALKEHKKRVGEVEYVAINERTTFEFPASLSKEEREIRIENYKKRHKPEGGVFIHRMFRLFLFFFAGISS